MSTIFGLTLHTQVIWGTDQQEHIARLVKEFKYFILEVSIKRTVFGKEQVTVLGRMTTPGTENISGTCFLVPTEI